MKFPRKRSILIFTILGLVATIVALRISNRRIPKEPVHVGQSRGLPLEVVTYNAHLVPPVAAIFIGKRSDASHRAAAIAAKLRKHDIVGICEVFDENAASILIDEFNSDPDCQFSFIRSPTAQKLSQLTSGGLIIFSRLPVIEQHTMTFSQGSRLIATRFQSGDGLAAKGALHARVRIESSIHPHDQPELELDCFLTHLDSHSRSIRRQQIAELIEFIASHHQPENPILILGDFNIPANEFAGAAASNDPESEYSFLMQQLMLVSNSIEDTTDSNPLATNGTSDALSADGGDRIDYLFLGVPAALTPRWTTQTRTLRLLDERIREGSLSDHAAVWCRIDLVPLKRIDD